MKLKDKKDKILDWLDDSGMVKDPSKPIYVPTPDEEARFEQRMKELEKKFFG